jgi:oligosaccharyltransferase complex subunit delta (ribophorin II)
MARIAAITLVMAAVAMSGAWSAKGQSKEAVLALDSFLAETDLQRLKEVFLEAARGPEAQAAAYAVLGLQAMGQQLPKSDSAATCKLLQAGLDQGSSVDITQLSTVARAAEVLDCGLKASADVSGYLQKAVTTGESAADVNQAFAALTALKTKPDAKAVFKALTAALKKDDSVANLGHALQLAATLDVGAADLKTVADRAGDAFVQADEVDGRMLQFEGGLSTTSLVISGAYALATKTKTAPPISKVQAIKFANYLVSRKSVQTAKGGAALLAALTVLADNPFHVPVAITLSQGASVVTSGQPKVKVRVTNVLGRAIAPMTVTLDAATRVTDGAVVLAKSKMIAAGGQDSASYEVDLLAAKPGRGFYDLRVSASPSGKADARLAGNEGVSLLVKALSSVEVVGAEIGLADADQSTAAKLKPIQPPATLATPLSADHHHKVLFKFALMDTADKSKMRVHQAFVRLVHVDTNDEIIFVAEADASSNVYQFDLDVAARSEDFGGRSGVYRMYLIVGDAVVANPINWHVGDLKLAFPEGSASSESFGTGTGPKPEIRHMFREPEKRPPPSVSTVFTALCVAPVLIMLIGWLKIGVNISAFPWSLSALGFHAGLGAIFGLYYYFWLQLNMFTTVKYLFMVGVVTFLCGNGMLVAIADKRKKAEK